jgi:carboxyl-terminal processing protease
MLEKLEDPYTRFMDPQEFRNMQVDTSGELTGIGIQISQEEETNEIMVVSPIEDTPAFEAGIRSQDVIIAIDGRARRAWISTMRSAGFADHRFEEVTITIRPG